MRKHLRDLSGKRASFTAIVSRYGSKRRYMNESLDTLLLEDIQDRRGRLVTDHAWLIVTLQIARLHLLIGEVVAFEARIESYVKGYSFGRYDAYNPTRMDYRLVDLRHIRRIESLQNDENEDEQERKSA